MEDKEQIPAKPIILPSGPPGAGKSTISHELVAISPGPVAYIEGDKFWPFFAKGWDDFEVAKNFKILMASITAAALPYARGGYEVVLDFSVPPWFLRTVFAMVSKRDVSLHYVIVRPDKAICANRAATRAEGAIPYYSRYDKMYASFDDAPACIISDDVGSAAVLATRIRAGVDKGLYLVTEQNLPKPKIPFPGNDKISKFAALKVSSRKS